MKKFLKKFFFWDDPAAGAGFALILSAVVGLCTANLACFNQFFFHSLFYGVMIFPDPLLNFSLYIPLILKFLFCIYTAFLFLRFFFIQDESRFKLIFWLILLIEFALQFAADTHRGKLLIALAAGSIGFNALCIRKNNYGWFIAQALCLLLCLPGVTILFDSLNFLEQIGDEVVLCPIPVALRIPLVYSILLFYLLSVFCKFKLWASANGKRVRDLWGMGCKVLVVLGIFAYVGFCIAALSKHNQCEKTLAALEEKFQRKISGAALKDIYYHNRRTDEKFHTDLEKAWKNFHKDDRLLDQIFSESAALNKLPEQYRNKFFSAEAENFGKFFDAPLPARHRDYKEGRLIVMMLPDLNVMRRAAWFFAWQIRIACENKDHEKAMQAWKRSGFITEYLDNDTSLIALLVRIAVEQIRLNSLEMMLSSNLLTDDELSEIQQYLRQSAQKMPLTDRDALYFEAVFANDAVRGLVDGSTAQKPDCAGAEGIRNYRFLVPGLWFLAECNYYDLLPRYHVEKLSAVNDNILTTPQTLLAAMLLPALRNAGDRIYGLQMRYQAFNALIEAEKIRRKTGKYPEKLPLDITDHFSGKPLLYKIGKHEKNELHLEKEKHPVEENGPEYIYSTEYRTKTVYGVAVWSVGRNKTDDAGLYGTSDQNGNRTDDPRALLIITATQTAED